MDERENKRGHSEIFIRGKHLKLTELKEELQRMGKDNNYIFKENIPLYPRPEFRVSHLSHDTNALFEIVLNNSGFRAPSWENPGQWNPKDPHRKDLIWWSLSVQSDMKSAETRLLDRTYPDRTEEQASESGQKDFLWRFATSPAFLDTSRYGSFRLTFPLEELLAEYRKQVCNGSEPVLRVYETVMYKQEVMYSVLVHSDYYNNDFKEYSLLDDSPDAVCAFKDGKIIWRPEAMCETHRYQLVPTPQKQLVAHLRADRPQFYVWDHVAVAFHLPEAETLDIDPHRMRCNLRFCEPGQPTVTPQNQFYDFETAKELVEVTIAIIVSFILEAFVFHMNYSRKNPDEDEKGIESEVVVSRDEVLAMLELYKHTCPGHNSLQDVLKDMDPSGHSSLVGRRLRTKCDLSLKMYAEEIEEWYKTRVKWLSVNPSQLSSLPLTDKSS